MTMSPYDGRGFYDPQSEVNRLFDEMFGGLGNASRRQRRVPHGGANRRRRNRGTLAAALARGGGPAKGVGSVAALCPGRAAIRQDESLCTLPTCCARPLVPERCPGALSRPGAGFY